MILNCIGNAANGDASFDNDAIIRRRERGGKQFIEVPADEEEKEKSSTKYGDLGR